MSDKDPHDPGNQPLREDGATLTRTTEQIWISLLKDKHDSAPQQISTTWEKFGEGLRKVRYTECTIATCLRGNLCSHKNGRSWSPAIYPPGSARKKQFVKVVYALVIDLDHQNGEELANAEAHLQPYRRIVHASHSDRPAGCTICTCGSEPGALHGQNCPSRVDRCLRVIIFLNRPVPGDQWGRFWPSAMKALKQPADPTCCDASRLYFLPSRPKDADYYFEAHDGIPLDVDAILAIAPEVAPSIADNLQIEPDGVVVPGQRHAMLKSIAGALRYRGAGYAEIEAALLTANRMRCNPPKTDSEVRGIARWAADQAQTTLPGEEAPNHTGENSATIGTARQVGGEHDADAAIDFLTWAYPEGPWCLTAVEVDRYGIETATFFPHTAVSLRDFLATYAQWNLYWSVNRPMRELSKKAEKTDIATAHFLHVDVNFRDPKQLRDGEDFITERERILRLLTAPPVPIPKPSAVIFSGGGYQALWRLDEPFVIDGDLAKAEELESYNRQLEWSFDAEACHNVDRILRLVGSVNYPSAKKRAKGRTIERAVLV